jgi:GWxTD domain-containing protein
MAALLALPISVWAALPVAPALAAGQEVNLEEFPKLELEDLPSIYQQWLEEVHWIITPTEKDVFLRLRTNERREDYIERFWEVRDPTPGTPDNEYRDLHYERLAYVERHFGRDTPRAGWRTDRGRYYIILGEPMNRKTLPNTQLAYPVEIWWYHAEPKLGIPPFFYLLFYKAFGTGEYQLYSPLVDGPMRLLNPAGESEVRQIQSGGGPEAGRFGTPQMYEGELGAAYQVLQDVDGELAQVSLSFLPGDQSALMGSQSLRSEMMIADIARIPERIMPNPMWAYRTLTGETEANVRFETLPMRADAIALLDPSGVPFLHYAVRTEGGRLNLNQYEDRYYITFEVSGAVLDDHARTIARIEGAEGGAKILQADLDEEQARRLRRGPILHMDRMPLVTGHYKLDLILENNVSHEFGRAEFELNVPQPRPGGLRTSNSILIDRFEIRDDYDPYGGHLPFQVGRLVLVPAVEGEYLQGSSLNVYHQIYFPANATHRVASHYTLANDSGIVLEKTIYVDPNVADRHGAVNQIATLDLTDIQPGNYNLTVDVDDDGRPVETFDVRVVSEELYQIPYVQALSQSPPADPSVGLALARQFRVLGETDRAIAALDAALTRAPDFEEGLDLQTELLMDAGRFEDVIRLLTPELVQDPSNEELLVTLAQASANLARHYDAIRYYERARMIRGDTPEILNPLAAEYFADQQLEKAKEILELSLQINPDQEEMQRLLDQVLGQVQE